MVESLVACDEEDGVGTGSGFGCSDGSRSLPPNSSRARPGTLRRFSLGARQLEEARALVRAYCGGGACRAL